MLIRSTTRKEIEKMKKLMMAVAGLALGACMTAEAGYRTETTVAPGAEAHQYVVQVKIIDVAKDGKTDVLSTPKVTVKAGEEGKITVGDEKEQNGVFCTALVKETEGGIEAVTTVVVKEKGTEKLNTTQSVTLKK
jgi:type II secretory pathway component GspD/PulD (secretin)